MRANERVWSQNANGLAQDRRLQNPALAHSLMRTLINSGNADTCMIKSGNALLNSLIAEACNLTSLFLLFVETAASSVLVHYLNVISPGCLASQNVPYSLRSASLPSHDRSDLVSCCSVNLTVTNQITNKRQGACQNR